MRLLHTSDWHLGRAFCGFGILDHQAAVLDDLVAAARADRVDAVLLSGDVYDRAVPPPEAVALLSETLARLRDTGAAVIVIAGNHDSATRLAFAEPVLAAAGVHVRGPLEATARPVVLTGASGVTAAVYPIPYVEPAAAEFAFAGEARRDPAAVLAHLLAAARADRDARGNARAVVIAHAFVTGGTPSDSERQLSVGGSGEVALGAFAGFDYAALGHLHRRQSLGRGRARYAGSPLAYSFSETASPKGGWLVELPAAGAARVHPVDVSCPRALATVEGTVDELLSGPRHEGARDAWVQAVVTDEVLAPDAVARLRMRFPHLAQVVRPERPAGSSTAPARSRAESGRSDIELFRAFWAHTTGTPATAELEERFLRAAASAEPDREGGTATAGQEFAA